MAGSPRLPRERVRVFWRARIGGASVSEAAAVAGVSVSGALRWVAESGGMIPELGEPSGRFLSFAEREEIALGWERGLSQAEIARTIGRHRSTVCRELARNRTRKRLPREWSAPRPRHQRWRYRAGHAQAQAEARAKRPKLGTLATNAPLAAWVQGKLGGDQRWSPEQIAASLPVAFPDHPEMRVSHETIYRALYVQGRGQLRRELRGCLRTGRGLRKPRRVPGEQRGTRRIPVENMITARPPEIDDRRVPGHWESQ